MTALSDKQVVPPAREKKDFTIGVAADAVIFPGARCAIVGGYLQPADETPGLKHFCTATNKATVDNTGGANGDVTCSVEFDQVKTLMWCSNDGTSPLTAAHIGGDAFIVDDSGVVSADGAGRTRLGTPWIIIGASDPIGQRPGVYVEVDGDGGPLYGQLTGAIDLAPSDFYLLTGAPLAVFADGASAVPGSAVVDSKAFGVRWNNNATLNAIVTAFRMPRDCDVSQDMTLTIYASKVGATLADAVTFDVAAFNQVVGALHDADSDFGGVTTAMTGDAATKTIQAVTRTLAAANLAASPASVTLSIKPTNGTLGTDDLVFHGARIAYTRKVVTS